MSQRTGQQLSHIELLINRSLHLKLTNIQLNKNKTVDDEAILLKVKQIQTIIASCEGKDVMAILATGFGKSLIFEAIPIYLKLSQGFNIKTIIMSPLNVIIEQQLAKLGTDASSVDDAVRDDDSASDSSDDEYGDKLIAGKAAPVEDSALDDHTFKFIVGHPEEFLRKETMEAMRTSPWASEVKKIVVDECHTVSTWSKDFRTDFAEIHQLKAIFPSATFLGLTATASPKMQADIQRLLNMSSPTVISTSVDRVNTKYSVIKRDSNYLGTETSYTGVFMPYVKELKLKGSNFPKTVVYSNLEWCGFGNELGVRHLTTNVNSDGVPQIAQYHAPLSAMVKQKVAEKMRAKDGHLRLLLATEAYGMGVHTEDIRRVVHAGPPCSLSSYMQTTGRGGRDGLHCDAILHYNNADVGKIIVDQEMKEFCRLSLPGCRRQYLCEHFGTEPTFRGLKHNCCDLCESQCVCVVCTTQTHLLSQQQQEDAANDHSKNVERAVYDYMTQLFHLLNSICVSPIDTQLSTGLTEKLAKDIATNYEHLMTIDSLTLMYMHLDSEPLQQILEGIRSCYRDFC